MEIKNGMETGPCLDGYAIHANPPQHIRIEVNTWASMQALKWKEKTDTNREMT
jgi:hypothetical protein